MAAPAPAPGPAPAPAPAPARRARVAAAAKAAVGSKLLWTICLVVAAVLGGIWLVGKYGLPSLPEKTVPPAAPTTSPVNPLERPQLMGAELVGQKISVYKLIEIDTGATPVISTSLQPRCEDTAEKNVAPEAAQSTPESVGNHHGDHGHRLILPEPMPMPVVEEEGVITESEPLQTIPRREANRVPSRESRPRLQPDMVRSAEPAPKKSAASSVKPRLAAPQPQSRKELRDTGRRQFDPRSNCWIPIMEEVWVPVVAPAQKTSSPGSGGRRYQSADFQLRG